MPQFAYEVRSASGKLLKGKLTTQDRAAAVEELRKRNLTVLQVEQYEEGLLSKQIYIGNPVKRIDFIIYCRQFATLIRAGVAIVEATNILALQTESKVLRKALLQISSSLLRGHPYSTAAQEHKKIFPPIFVSMIRAGEEAGDLEGTLERLAHYFEKQHVTKEKIKSAMAYPVAVGLLSIIVVIYMLVEVVPQFATMFASLGADLPVMTKVVLQLSGSLSANWYIWLLLVIFIAVAYSLTMRTAKGRYYRDYFNLKVPIFGKLNQKSAIAQMTRTLASLYASSVPVLQSLAIVEQVVGNNVISYYIAQSSESLRQGKPLSEPMKNAWVFPPLVTQMIAVGEETGALDHMLGKIADFYEMDVDNTVDRLKSLIEPLLIVFLAVVVGLIVLAIVLPMFSLYSALG